MEAVQCVYSCVLLFLLRLTSFTERINDVRIKSNQAIGEKMAMIQEKSACWQKKSAMQADKAGDKAHACA